MQQHTETEAQDTETEASDKETEAPETEIEPSERETKQQNKETESPDTESIALGEDENTGDIESNVEETTDKNGNLRKILNICIFFNYLKSYPIPPILSLKIFKRIF